MLTIRSNKKEGNPAKPVTETVTEVGIFVTKFLA